MVGDSLPATAKKWLYQHLIVAKLSWHFTSLDARLPFAKNLQALAVAYFKRWQGHAQQTSPLFTLEALSEPARELHILLPCGKRCRLCTSTVGNNAWTVVVPFCMTAADSCSARNGVRIGMHQRLSMHVH